jgi:hypothetical protein
LISGTSADGVGAALARIRDCPRDALSPNERLQLEAFAAFPYPPESREQMLAASLPAAGAVDLIRRLNIGVDECFEHLVGFLVAGIFDWTFGDAEVVTMLWFVIGMGLGQADSAPSAQLNSSPLAR